MSHSPMPIPKKDPKQNPKKNNIPDILLLVIESLIAVTNTKKPKNIFGKNASQNTHLYLLQEKITQGSPRERKRNDQIEKGSEKPMRKMVKGLLKK